MISSKSSVIAQQINPDETLGLEKSEVQSSEVFTSFNTLVNKTMTIEFKLSDVETQAADLLQENTSQSFSVPLTPTLTQFGTTFCPYPLCSPPPGKFI